MVVRIVWSELSKNQLKNIFDYYSVEVSIRVANKFVDKIIDRVSILENNPFVGHKEELLQDYPEDFRYLVEGNYKIIYWVNTDLATISSVFDSRQNPIKMNNF